MIYQVLHLKDKNSNGLAALLKTVADLTVTIGKQGHTTFGLFPGLFGLATNELYWVLMSEPGASDPASAIESSGLTICDHKSLVPTVRPTDHVARTEPGVYVFRWFKVRNKDVDEIAALSEQAWRTFEAGFDTAVQGLFAEAERETDNNEGTMLLITWYRDLSVWQDSRQPATEARELFKKRHQLTKEARPIATRLYRSMN